MRLRNSPGNVVYSFLVSQMAGCIGNITEYMARFNLNLAGSRLSFFPK